MTGAPQTATSRAREQPQPVKVVMIMEVPVLEQRQIAMITMG
jgi:hypothetical protein